MYTSSTTSICLNMIVKDEAHIIEKTLNNILQYIPITYWVICDTGSTDDTVTIIKRFFNEKNIQGEIHLCTWKGFGKSRTEALELAYNKTDYLFIFDADDAIHGDFKLPTSMTMDSYHFRFGQGFSYTRPLLVTNRKEWKYVGVLHEYLTEKVSEYRSSFILESGNYYVESGRSGGRNQDPDKYSKDAATLEHEIATEPDKGLCDRYAFYLAQSYKDANKKDKAMEWYLNVLSRNNWAQEKYFSCLTLGNMYKDKENFEKAVLYLTKTNEYDDQRFDGLIFLMENCYNKGMHYMVDMLYTQIQKNYHNLNLSRKLFVYQYLYDEVMDYLNVISCFYTKNFNSGYESIKKIAAVQKLDSNKMNATLNNMIFYLDVMKKDVSQESVLFFHHFIEIIAKKCGIQQQNISPNECTIFNLLLEKNKNTLTKYKSFKTKNNNKLDTNATVNPNIMITFTTCKRFELFTQTMNSIMNTWTDAVDIQSWFCVDDNSSETDRINMKKLYPWVNFYLKTEAERGHMISMNIIWNELKKHKPTYWIHMEDDFLFFERGSYVAQAIKGLTVLKKENVHQILFNRSYAETINGYNIVSHEYINEENEFCVHKYEENTTCKLSNCHYWPHYSFRPSMMRTDIILKLGDFNSDITFFEREYANKYQRAGYKSGFFNKLTNLHIGRLTKDKDNATIPNAYQLNNMNQFTNDANKNADIENKESDKPNVLNESPEPEKTINVSGTSFINAFSESSLHTDDSVVKYAMDLTNISKPGFLLNYSKAESVTLINEKLKDIGSNLCVTSINNSIGNPTNDLLSSETQTNVLLDVCDLPDNTNISPYIKIVNLQRRPDRKINTETLLSEQNIDSCEYEFVNAVDGLELEVTDEMIDMFDGNDFGNRKGVIGCALSHVNLWKQLLNDKHHDFYLILEDDLTVLTDNFKERISLLRDNMKSQELLFLGYHMFDKKRKDSSPMYDPITNNQFYSKTLQGSIKSLNKDLYIGGTFMYGVNKSGAKKMIDYIESRGIKHGIDYVMKIIPDLNVYETLPQLAFSPWNENGNNIDTDVQNTGVAFDLNRLLVKDPDFIFIPQMDQMNFDMGQKFMKISQLKKEILKMPDCVAFNTLCFLKNNINKLHSSNYFKKNDGIYIKIDRYYYMQNELAKELESKIELKKRFKNNKIRVKLMGNWCSSRVMCEEWKHMCKYGNTWNNIEFVSDDCDIDYFVIINKPMYESDFYIPEKTIIFQMEPWIGVKTWGSWACPDEHTFFKVFGRKTVDYKTEVNNVQWQLELSYSDLLELNNASDNKLDIVSCICSSKYNDPGHIHRIDFLNYIETKQTNNDERNDTIPLVVFSNTNFGKFSGYRGKLDMAEKSKGYVPFKYYFMCENNYEINYITEKLWEPILCECLCFYYGCPNVGDYVDERAYVQLDMTDFEKSYKIIQKAIKEDWWSQRIEIIRIEKLRILNEMQFCPRVEKIINENMNKNE